jgi:hypothetical protein
MAPTPLVQPLPPAE